MGYNSVTNKDNSKCQLGPFNEICPVYFRYRKGVYRELVNSAIFACNVRSDTTWTQWCSDKVEMRQTY